MFNRGIIVVIAFFIFTLNTKPASSITIPAGGEGIYHFELTFSPAPGYPMGWDIRLIYDLAFTDGWNGTLSLYEDLNQAPIITMINPYPSTTEWYLNEFDMWAYPSLFDDIDSYWKISPLTTITVLDYNPPEGPTATLIIPSEGYQYTTFGALTVTSTVPEPSTLLLLGSGLVGLIGIGRRRLRIGIQRMSAKGGATNPVLSVSAILSDFLRWKCGDVEGVIPFPEVRRFSA